MLKCLPVLVLLLSAFAGGLPSAGVNPLPAEPKTGTIKVTMGAFRNQKGQLCVSLFSSPKGFPGKAKKAVRTFKCPIKGDAIALTFKALPAGTYAIAVLHDENMNGKMNTSFWGIPKEGGGASRNPKPRRGPPRFQDAKFELKDKPIDLKIKLVYPP